MLTEHTCIPIKIDIAQRSTIGNPIHIIYTTLWQINELQAHTRGQKEECIKNQAREMHDFLALLDQYT